MYIITFRLFKRLSQLETMTVTTVISMHPLHWWNDRVWATEYREWDGCNLLMIYEVN